MIIDIISKFNDKGVKRANTSFGTLAKRALAANLSVAGLGYAMAKMVRAAADDERAVVALSRTLANAGWSNATESVNAYIDATQRATGITDDELRPAFTSLFNSLQDANAAMAATSLAMDIARGTGRDLATVSSALSKAFSGNRKSLQSLGTGVDATFLKTAELNEVMRVFAERFAGQAATAAETAAGKYDRLKIAAAEASETIGGALIDSFAALAAGGSVQDATTAIDDASEALARFIREASGAQKPTTFLTAFMYELGQGILKGPVDALGKLFGLRLPNTSDFKFEPIDTTVISRVATNLRNQLALQKALLDAEKKREAAAKAAAAKAAAKARADEAAKKKAAALEKAGAELAMKYDIERIGYTAAYAKTRDAETKQRLLDLATLNTMQYAQNLGLETMEQIIARTLADLQKFAGAQKAWTDEVGRTLMSFAQLETWAAKIDAMIARLQTAAGIQARASGSFNTSTLEGIAAAAAGSVTGALGPNPIGNLTSANTTTLEGILAQSQYGPGATPGQTVNVTVNAPVISERDLASTIGEALAQAQRSGQSTTRLFSTL